MPATVDGRSVAVRQQRYHPESVLGACVDGTWEADDCENAVIVQPGSVPAGVELSDQPVGPTLYDLVEVLGSPA